MEDSPVRLSTRCGGRNASGKEIHQIDAVLFRQCASTVLVQSVAIRKLPPEVADVPLTAILSVNGSCFTTKAVVPEVEEAVRDPATGSLLPSSVGRHRLYQVRFDDLHLLFPGTRSRGPSRACGGPRASSAADPGFISNPRSFLNGVKVTLRSSTIDETVFGSTICVCSGEASYLNFPRGEATINFRVLPCVEGEAILEPLYHRTALAKTYLKENHRELVQAEMARRRAEMREKDDQQPVKIVPLEEVEMGMPREDSPGSGTHRSNGDGNKREGVGEGGKGGGLLGRRDGEQDELGKILTRRPSSKAEREWEYGLAHHEGGGGDDGKEEEEEEEDPAVAGASHIAVGGSYVTLSTSFSQGIPRPEVLHRGGGGDGLFSSSNAATAGRISLEGVPDSPSTGTKKSGRTTPARGQREQQQQASILNGERDSDDEEEEEEEEDGGTKKYTEALTAKIQQLREQTEPHFPDPLTATMRALVPCDDETKLATAFGLYDNENKGVITRDALVHFCRAHQGYADWCEDDNTLLLGLAPYIPAHLFEGKSNSDSPEAEVSVGREEEQEKGEEKSASGLETEGEKNGGEKEGADAAAAEGSAPVAAVVDSSASFPRLNVDYLYYHPKNPDAPLRINRELFDVIAYRLARS